MKQLHNPITENYLQLKSLCLGNNFPYCYNSNTTFGLPHSEGVYDNFGFWSHSVLQKNEKHPILPRISEPYWLIFNSVLQEVFERNSTLPEYVFRVNVNVTLPTDKNLPCLPHEDHKFKHKNLLIYLNNSDGDTVEMDTDSAFTPKEDCIISFSGSHYHYPPTSGRRVVVVCTYVWSSSLPLCFLIRLI